MLQPFETWFFPTKIKGHHLQGNVQVFSVRIPVDEFGLLLQAPGPHGGAS